MRLLPILLASSSLLLLGCGGQKQSSDSPKFGTEVTALLSQQVIDSLCSLSVDPNTGEFISADAAYGMLQQYKAERRATVGAGYDPKNDVYGFVFGIEKIRELLAKIDTINVVHKDSLIGVRVYYTRSMRSGTPLPDVLLIPVSANKMNVYPIDADLRPDQKFNGVNLVLDTSVPCPNKCNQ